MNSIMFSGITSTVSLTQANESIEPNAVFLIAGFSIAALTDV